MPVLTLVEAKLSGATSKTLLRQQDAARKVCLMLEERPNVQKAFTQRRLCFIVGGLRQRQPEMNVTEVVEEIVQKMERFYGWPETLAEQRKLVA